MFFSWFPTFPLFLTLARYLNHLNMIIWYGHRLSLFLILGTPYALRQQHWNPLWSYAHGLPVVFTTSCPCIWQLFFIFHHSGLADILCTNIYCIPYFIWRYCILYCIYIHTHVNLKITTIYQTNMHPYATHIVKIYYETLQTPRKRGRNDWASPCSRYSGGTWPGSGRPAAEWRGACCSCHQNLETELRSVGRSRPRTM